MEESASIEDTCGKLQSVHLEDRIRALKRLIEFCKNEEKSQEDIILLYDKCYLHILKCYSDKFETCREISCLAVDEFIKRIPQNDFYLNYIVSSIASRIGQKENIESSEEIRLILFVQLNVLIRRFGKIDATEDPLKCCNEIIVVIKKGLFDPFPAVQREACSCIKEFAAFSRSFQYRAEELATPLYSVIRHKHFSNRIAAVEALRVVALHITTNSDCIVRIITEISPLLMDPVPIVRRECGKTGCLFLLKLNDRYSHFEKIIPLVLCCLNDDSAEVREDIQKLWIECGEKYFEENEMELNKFEVVDQVPENYPDNVRRPTLGCRALVQRSLRIVKLIMKEVTDWKEEVRLHSLKLLWQLSLHAEDALTPHFMDIYPGLSRACKDDELSISKMAMQVGNLLGRLLKYEDWFLHGAEKFKCNANLCYLKCFYCIFSASNVSNMKDVSMLAEIISKPDFAHSIDEEFQKYLLQLAAVLYDRFKNRNNSIDLQMNNLQLDDFFKIEENLYAVVIKVMALSFERNDQAIFRDGRSILLKLANQDEQEIIKLHKKYLKNILRNLQILDTEFDEQTEPILLLYGIIRICGFGYSYLEELRKCIRTVWDHGPDGAKLKILSSISVAMLTWNETMCLESDKNVSILKSFLEDIVVEHLIWKPGYAAESFRSIGAAILCSVSEGVPLQAQEILPKFVKYFPNLLEDNAVSTRLYALRCFNNFGKVKLESLKEILKAILQRLDDPSYEIRKWAALVISKLRVDFQEDQEKEIWKSSMKHILSVLLLHFDNAEQKLKAVIRDSIFIIGKEFPELVGDFYKEINELFSNSTGLEDFHALFTK